MNKNNRLSRKHKKLIKLEIKKEQPIVKYKQEVINKFKQEVFLDRIHQFNKLYKQYLVDIICIKKKYVIIIDGKFSKSTNKKVKDAHYDWWFTKQKFRIFRINTSNYKEVIDSIKRV